MQINYKNIFRKSFYYIYPSVSAKWMPSLFLFPSSSIGKKRPFDKAFNINCRPLTDDHTKKDVKLSYAECQYPPAVKANRFWQREFLDWKPLYMIEVILLAAAVFWDPNFVSCSWHTLNLAKKLGLKIKNLKSNIVKERI